MNLFTRLRLEKEWRGIKYQMELFAIENNVGDRKKFVKEIKIMYFIRDEISSMIYKLGALNSTNQAVPMMASILSASLMIIAQSNQSYPMEAMQLLSDLCKRIVQETGTPSEQFEMIAVLASLGQTQTQEEDEG